MFYSNTTKGFFGLSDENAKKIWCAQRKHINQWEFTQQSK